MTGLLPLLSWFFLGTALLPASEITLGGAAGWEQIVLVRDTALRPPRDKGQLEIRGNTIRTGNKNRSILALDEDAYERDARSDLILHFDAPGESIGPYKVDSDPVHYSNEQRVFGPSSALFRGTPEPLEMLPREGALLSPGSLWNDFTIEFWLRPQYMSHGEEVLSWKSNRLINDRVEAQELKASIADRTVSWSFTNVFFSPRGEPSPVRIRGRSPLVPESWHHFALRFEASTGMLLFQIDGIDQDVQYITSTGREGGTVFLPLIGGTRPEPLLLGGAYTGYIDELRISRSYREELHLKPYPLRSGIADTTPLDLQGSHTRIVSLSVEEEHPGASEIRYYYRRGDEKSDIRSLSGPWIPFSPEAGIEEDTKGRYLQLRFELFPDGSGTRSPGIREVSILYEQDRPPVPPSLIELEPMDGAIKVSWNSVSAHDLSGYLLFFGTEPGIYRGAPGTDLESPIDVGKAGSWTLQGLENGRLYFFRIAAYDNDDPGHAGPLSREVHTRPMKAIAPIQQEDGQ